MKYTMNRLELPALSFNTLIEFHSKEELQVLVNAYNSSPVFTADEGYFFTSENNKSGVLKIVAKGMDVIQFSEVFTDEHDKPEPGVKYVWYLHNESEAPAMMLRKKEHDNDRVVLHQTGFLPLRFQQRPQENTSLTVEEIKKWGCDPSAFDFYPLQEEPDKFIWVSNTRDSDGDALVLKRMTGGVILTQHYVWELENVSMYQKSDSFHLTEEEVSKWPYDLSKFTKIAIKGEN